MKEYASFCIEFRAVAMQLEVNRPQRDRLMAHVDAVIQSKQLKTMAKSILFDIIQSIPEAAPSSSIASTFVQLNQPLGIYFNQRHWPGLQSVSLDLHMLLHTGTTRPQSNKMQLQQAQAQKEHQQWISAPSLKRLTEIMEQIMRDEALHPQEHLPTLPDVEVEHAHTAPSAAFMLNMQEYDAEMRAKIEADLNRIKGDFGKIIHELTMRPASTYANYDIVSRCVNRIADAVVDQSCLEVVAEGEVESVPMERRAAMDFAMMEEELEKRRRSTVTQVLGKADAVLLSQTGIEELSGKTLLLYQRLQLDSTDITRQMDLQLRSFEASWKHLLRADYKALMVLVDTLTEDDAFDFASVVEEAQSQLDREIILVDRDFNTTISAAIEANSKAKVKPVFFLNGQEIMEQEDEEREETSNWLDGIVDIHISDPITRISSASYSPPATMTCLGGFCLENDLAVLKRCLLARSFVAVGGGRLSLDDSLRQLNGLLRLSLPLEVLLIG